MTPPRHSPTGSASAFKRRDAVLGRPLWPALWRLGAAAAACAALAGAPTAFAQSTSMGFRPWPQPDGGTTVVFYPTQAPEQAVTRGPFQLNWAENGEPVAGNGRLVVISHGSGGSPWVHADLARTLVSHGFVVAVPQHAHDNHLDPSEPGPDSWKRRPLEVSQAIDRVAAHPELARHLKLDAGVGVFGGSAGGHTALSLAGGEWSPRRFRDHCLQHLREDFSSCVGFTTLLRGNGLDALKLWVAQGVIRWRFGDDTPQRHTDPRVAAVVAMVPFAADFSPESLRVPRVPLALVVAEGDVNQVPRFHAQAVLAACEPRCERLVQMPEAGHGAMLSPLPPFEPGSVAEQLLSDPPGFDRAQRVPEVHQAVAAFFLRTLRGTP